MRQPRIVAIAVLAVACTDPFEPAILTGSHELTHADDLPLPQLVAASEECDMLLEDGHLSMALDSTFVLALDIVADCTRVGGEITELPDTTRGSYAVGGRQVLFDAAGGEADFVGRRTETGVVVVLPQLGARSAAELTFRRSANQRN